MINFDELKFDEKGLIPAIVFDADTKKVLTLAYMNKESLEISVNRQLTCFYSRSRNELWLKGETSGNYQHIVSITADCDKDALLVAVHPDGPACHTGTTSCFNDLVFGGEEDSEFSYAGLYKLIEGRKTEKKDGSYTTSRKDTWQMFDAGIASQTFCLAAHEYGLGTVIMGIFDDTLSDVLQIPDDRELVNIICIGHPAESPEMPKRKTVADLLTYK